MKKRNFIIISSKNKLNINNIYREQNGREKPKHNFECKGLDCS